MPSKPSRLPTAHYLLNGLAEKELGEENELHDLSCNGKSIARCAGSACVIAPPPPPWLRGGSADDEFRRHGHHLRTDGGPPLKSVDQRVTAVCIMVGKGWRDGGQWGIGNRGHRDIVKADDETSWGTRTPASLTPA